MILMQKRILIKVIVLLNKYYDKASNEIFIIQIQEKHIAQ